MNKFLRSKEGRNLTNIIGALSAAEFAKSTTNKYLRDLETDSTDHNQLIDALSHHPVASSIAAGALGAGFGSLAAHYARKKYLKMTSQK